MRKRTAKQKKHEYYTKLNAIIQDRKVKKAELAEHLGIAPSSFTLKMNGQQDFSISEIEKLCVYLHCNPGVVFSDRVCRYKNYEDTMIM